jgi:hypothetical protein
MIFKKEADVMQGETWQVRVKDESDLAIHEATFRSGSAASRYFNAISFAGACKELLHRPEGQTRFTLVRAES